MKNFLAEVEVAMSSGRWWDNRWWANPVYREEFKLEAREVEDAFGALKKVFDEAWSNAQVNNVISEARTAVESGQITDPSAKWYWEETAKAKTRHDEFQASAFLVGQHHPFFGHLFGAMGRWPFLSLFRLGRGLKLVEQAGLMGNSASRLRGAGEFSGASQEVSALARWIEAGVNVERDVPSGRRERNCDWKVSDGKDAIYGDVKCIEVSGANTKRSILASWISQQVLDELTAKGLKGRFHLELKVRPGTPEEVNRLRQGAAEISVKIVRHILEGMEEGIGEWKEVEGLARYCFVPVKGSDSLQGSMGGIPVNAAMEAKKIMKIVREAESQFPVSGPGVLMIAGSAATVFSDETAQQMIGRFRRKAKEFLSISGVLVVKSMLSPKHGEVNSAVFVVNPNGPPLNMELLGKGFLELEVWKAEA